MMEYGSSANSTGDNRTNCIEKSSNNGGIVITAYYMFHPLKMGLLEPPTDFHITSGVQP